jgi:O-acetyl-ADP-ribose deacetylase (regulator of RNase III)
LCGEGTKMMDRKINNTVIELVEGDITGLSNDAIVNAANERLVLGGGVAGAISRKGGPSIQAECDKIGSCPAGQAAITTGGNLKAKYVIHAVGPRMGEGDEDEKLRSATLSSLKLADEKELKTIAFPAISTGIFGYPLDKCAEIMLTATAKYLKGKTGLQKVVFCLFDDDAYDFFANELKRLR